MKKIFGILMVLSLFATSCKKETENDAVRVLFEKSQGHLFTHVDNTHILSIYLGGSSDVSALKMPVTIAEGEIGGKKSLSDLSFVSDYVYSTSTATYQAYFSENEIVLNDSMVIEVLVSNGSITQLIYKGNIYTLSSMNFNQGIAGLHEIGRNPQLIPKNTISTFSSCDSGSPMLVSFNLDDNNKMSIVSDVVSVEGTLTLSDCGTPVLEGNDGGRYLVAFYTTDATNISPATVRFQLYQIMMYKPLGLKKSPVFKLVIGNC